MIRILQNNSYQCSVSKRTVVSGSKTALIGVHEIQFARKKKKKKKLDCRKNVYWMANVQKCWVTT